MVSSAPVYAAMVCAGAAAWLMGGRNRAARRARVLLADGAMAGPVRPPWERARAWCRARLRPEWWCLVAGVMIALVGESFVPLLAGAVGVPLAGRARRARAARHLTGQRADAVIALCGALAGEVRAGRQPTEALLVAARDSGGLGAARGAVVAAARFGGDVPRALCEDAREPGAEGLGGLAACWRVAVDRGAGLAAGLERLESALRAERDQRADLRAQLAGARSTAVLLAALPLLGLLLGTALGADPLRVLLHTGPGLACLLVGGVLEGAGLWWALRIVRGAEER
ncbi:type II secretion system F family protein [Streptomyces jeddahensis]|nr:type II secretion system F family protein [Streptomyces jeddahensis]